MNVIIISFDITRKLESLTLLNILKKKYNINIIYSNRCLNQNKLLTKFGNNIKIIFITRTIKDVLISIKNRELKMGIKWIQQHYHNLNSDFTDYPKLFIEDTLNFEKLYDSYINTKIFPVLFIKFEKLYSENNNKTINMIEYFLNIKFEPNDFKFNKENELTSNKEIVLSEEEIKQINKTFFSLQNKINKYDYQLINFPIKTNK